MFYTTLRFGFADVNGKRRIDDLYGTAKLACKQLERDDYCHVGRIVPSFR